LSYLRGTLTAPHRSLERRYIRQITCCHAKDGPGRLRLASRIFQERQSDKQIGAPIVAACRQPHVANLADEISGMLALDRRRMM
jgi:hypothetical protein